MKKFNNNPIVNFELLYTDDSCIAVHKAPGIPCQTKSQAPPHPLDHSLQLYLNESVRIWTRIDQPVSGIVLFYRDSEKINTSQLSVDDKEYLGIVEGHPPEQEQTHRTIVSCIRRDGKSRKAVEDNIDGKISRLTYTVLKKFDRYTLLKIKPETGRFHQIRYQMAHIGYPIKGDVKYGARRKNKDRSIHLHALEYVIRKNDRESQQIRDFSFPDDPLWSLARTFIDSE